MTAHDLLPTVDLEPAASRLDVPAGDVRHVMARGRARNRRRTGGAAVLAAVALVGAGSVALDRSGDREGTNVRIADTALLGDVPMSWRTVDPESALGFSRDLAGTGTPSLYALSTSAGTADVGRAHPSRVVWRSEDGVEWTATRPLGGDLYLSDLATAGDRVYAVGTGAATAATGGAGTVSPVLVGWSDDGAKSWQRQALDVDVVAIDRVASSVRMHVADVATGPAGTVVTVAVSAVPDVPELLPDGLPEHTGLAMTTQGVDLLGKRGPKPCPAGTETRDDRPADVVEAPGSPSVIVCLDGEEVVATVTRQEAFGVVRSFTWEELGLEGDVLRAARRQPIAYFAPAGSTEFERVELPETGPVHEVMAQAVGDGFDVAMTVAGPAAERSRVVLLHSDDGRSWVPVGGRTGLEWVVAMGRLDGRPAMVGEAGNGALLAQSNGDGSWRTTPLRTLMDDVEPGSQAHVAAADIGPLGAVISVVVVPKDDKPSDFVPRLLISRDGATWSDTLVADIAGRRVRGVSRVLVSGDRVLVTASAAERDDERAEHIVLLGSPG